MAETCLTIPRGLAARRYRDTFERTERQGNAERRIMALQAHRAAKASLTPQQGAIAEMALLKGQELTVVARKADRSVSDLEAMLAGALDALIDHYRIVDLAEAA